MSTGGERVRAAVEEYRRCSWYDGGGFDEVLADPAVAEELDEPGAIAALAEWCDQAIPVHQRLRQRPPVALVRALAPLLAAPRERRAAWPLVRARLQQALMAEPSAAAELEGAARELASALLTEAGAGLAPATWSSPWVARRRKPQARPGAAKSAAGYAIAPAVYEERLVEARRDAARPDGERDAQLAGHFAQYPELSILAQMSDDAARPRWLRYAFEPELCRWPDAEQVRTLLARFGAEGIDSALALVSRHKGCLDGLAAVDSPRVAPLMAEGLGGRPEQVAVARAWFDRFPEAAALGLVPAALDANKATSARAADALRLLRRRQPEALARALPHYDAAVREAIADRMDRAAELPPRKPTLPEAVAVDALPRPIANDGKSALQGAALAELLQLLKITPLQGGPWLDDVRGAFTAPSLARTAFALFESWLSIGAPPKERWMLQSSAHFPDDETAAILAGFAREWAPRGLSSRAQEIVEVLGHMGTRTGLERVHDLSRKVRSKAFRARAELVFTAAAEKLGLTEDELAERLVPDFGLGPDGALPVEPVLRFTIDGIKPRFVDGGGKLVKALPQLDDESAGELAELKRKAPTLIREAAERLERRMTESRRMAVDHFVEVYLMNGLLRRLAERLVWTRLEGGRRTAFGVAGTGLVDVEGNAVVLPPASFVGVAHPLDLSASERVAWTQRLPESQPFEQLKRRCRCFESVDALRAALARWVGVQIDAPGVLRLEKLGWERGPMIGHGCYSEVSRAFPGGRASVGFEPGMMAGDPMMHQEQHVYEIELHLAPDAPAASLSEVERDLFVAFGAPGPRTPAA